MSGPRMDWQRPVLAAFGALSAVVAVACGSDDKPPATSPEPTTDGGASTEGGAAATSDFTLSIDRNAAPAGRVNDALFGHYDLSGALFRYDRDPVAAALHGEISEWRLGLGRWEITTELLPTLTDGSLCDLSAWPLESKAPSDELSLLASRDWFRDDGSPVTLADTQDDARYQLDYVRSVIDVALAAGATPWIDIDHMPRAFAANRTPSRTKEYLTSQPGADACLFSWTNRVSNAGPADAYLTSTPSTPPIFASAIVGLVKRVVEGSGAQAGRTVSHWELWNEPDLPYAWDRTFDDAKLTRFSTMAVQSLVLLDAYRKASSNPAAKALRFGLASFAQASTAVSYIAALDQAATPVPVDFFSFHAYSNDPLVIVNAIKAVADARAQSKRYSTAEIVLSEWGTDLAAPPDPKTFDGPLTLATVLVLGAHLGLDRAHHSILRELYPATPFGIVDVAGKRKPSFWVFQLLRSLLGPSHAPGERLSIAGAPNGDVDGQGTLVALPLRDSAGVLHLAAVNRSDAPKTLRVVDGSSVVTRASALVVYKNAEVGPESASTGETLTIPPRSIAIATF